MTCPCFRGSQGSFEGAQWHSKGVQRPFDGPQVPPKVVQGPSEESQRSMDALRGQEPSKEVQEPSEGAGSSDRDSVWVKAL